MKTINYINIYIRTRPLGRIGPRKRRAFLSALRWLAVERVLRAPELGRRLAGLTVPTVLVWGEHDHLVARAEGEALVELLPDARLAVIEGAGHLPHQERPASFLAVLRAALAGATPSAAGR